jgi:S1-C subfamily serine protease
MSKEITPRTRRRLTLSFLLALVLLLAHLGSNSPWLASNLYSAPQNQGEISELAKAATLEVFCDHGRDPFGYAGSGWQIRVDGELYLITNAHVIADCIDSGRIYVYDQEKQLHVTELLGYQYLGEAGERFDVAVLSGRDIAPVLRLAQTETKAGHWMLIAGWPSLNGIGYQSIAAGNVMGVVANGDIVSNTDSQKGMSGGPAINSRGEVIGIHYASTNERRPRTLIQPISRLCGVAVVCDQDSRPIFPLRFPDTPIEKYIPELETEE